MKLFKSVFLLVSLFANTSAFAYEIRLSPGMSRWVGDIKVTCSSHGDSEQPPCVIFPSYSIIMIGCARAYASVFVSHDRLRSIAEGMVRNRSCSAVTYSQVNDINNYDCVTGGPRR